MKISAVVVLYNPDLSVVENIQSYACYVDRIFAVDNSDSQSNSVINIIKSIPNLSFISLHGNYGIAKALNVGVANSLQQNYEWILTMDQDSCFSGNPIDEYKKYIQNNRISHRKIGLLCPQYMHDRNRSRQHEQYKQRSIVMQSANLVSADAFREIGLYNEDLFIDGVDYEYCFRLRKAGYDIIQCRDAQLQHAPAETRLLKIGSFVLLRYGIASPLRYYYQARNLLYIAKEFKSFRIILICICKLFKILLLFNDKANYLKMYFRGISDCLTTNFGKYNEKSK